MDQNYEALPRLQLPYSEHAQDGHTDSIYALQLSHPYIVSGSKDRTVRIWNIETQRLDRGPLLGHQGSVLALQFDHSPQQDVIVSGGTDNALMIWRFSTGELVRRIDAAHEESVLCLHFDRKYLVTGSKDTTVKIWDRRLLPSENSDPVPECNLLKTFTHHAAAVNAVRIHDDTIVSGAGDGLIHISSIETGQLQRVIRGHISGITSLVFNGRFIVSGSSDETVRVVDLRGGENAVLGGEHANLVRAVCVSFDGEARPERVISGDYDGAVVVWERERDGGWVVRGRLRYGDLQPPGLDIESSGSRVFALDANDRRVVCGGQGAVIEGWMLAT